MRKIVLMLSWRDIKNPKAGGAERHTHMMLQGLDQKEYRIIHISPMFEGADEKEIIDGVEYIRHGNIASVILYAWLFYLRHRKEILVVIDQCNTHRFFTPFWVRRDKRILYIHQLTVEIWNIMFPGIIGNIGKKLEPLMLKIYNKGKVITVSVSTKKELEKLGFQEKNILIIHNGVDFEIKDYSEYENDKKVDFIYVGRYAAYKGIDAAIEALGILKQKGIHQKLRVLGKRDDSYIEHKLVPIMKKMNLSYGEEESNDVIFKGFVSEEEKKRLQRNSLALLFPSIREGWGIIVLESGAVGTPSIVYNSPGCRDAVNMGKSGYLCDTNSTEELAKNMERVLLYPDEYEMFRQKSYEYSKMFKWEESRKKFAEFIERLKNEC